MSDLHSRIAANLADTETQIVAACSRSLRPRSSVRLVAVVKYAEWEWIQALIELGVHDLAENRPQQLIERSARRLQESPDVPVRWHLIGHLQRNKVRPILPIVAGIHSVDSLRLLQRIDQIAGELGLTPQVLLEVNVSGEESKDGFAPDTLRTEWPELARCQHIHIAGLMTMAPLSEDPEESRPTFTALRLIRDELADHPATSGRLTLPELSMGMSGDFEPAIEEGATLVRIGSRLFAGCD